MMAIIIFGCGGHAKSICDAMERASTLRVAGFVGETGSPNELLGRPVVDEHEVISGRVACDGVVLGIGDNVARRRLYEKLRTKFTAAQFPPIIDPSAVVSPHAQIGAGSVVLAHCVVNTAATLGRFCVINTGAIIEHDCTLDDFASLGPAAAIGGNCRIGISSHIGLGASMRHGITVGANTVLGAGATAVEDLSDNGVYLGVPARRARARRPDEPIF